MRPLFAAIVLAVAAIASACETSTTSSLDPGSPAMNASTATLLPQTVSALPSFDFGTYERLLYQLRGTPVVVNMWASWCGPCRSEAPVLVDAAKRYGHEVQFLGVDHQDQREPAAEFSTQYHVPYPSVFDASGEIHDELGFVGLPDTVFYDAAGNIIATWSGPLTPEALSENVDRSLSG
jgi:thiol-disulfide isomerase/thioredoxin